MAEILNIENVAINRPVRCTMFDRNTSEVQWYVDELTDCTLECEGEQVFTTGALGQNIAAFDRGKNASLTASNALMNFGLMAEQLGAEKKVADGDHKIIVPAFELLEVKVGDGATTVELSHEPCNDLKYVYSTHMDKSKNKKYSLDGIDDNESTFTMVGKVVTLPAEDFQAGDLIAVWYDRESERAVSITNNATAFSRPGKFVLEALVCEVCNPSVEYYAYIIFDNAKLDNNFSLELNNEAKQEFTINALQSYCSKDNELFRIIIAE